MAATVKDINTDTPVFLSDTVCFDQTYKSYYHPLCFYASKFVDPDDAEDLIENLFLKLWNKKQQFESTTHLQAFLYHAVRNACLDFKKSKKNKLELHEPVSENQPLPGDDQLHHLIKAEVLAEIYRAVNNLPSQCSKVIRMGYLEGMNNAEIADELGLSEQTVKNYKGRGLTILKDKLSGSAFTMLLLLVHWR